MISSVSGRYLRMHLLDCFHIAHTHLLVGLDVLFGGYDLSPDFLTFDFEAIIDFN